MSDQYQGRIRNLIYTYINERMNFFLQLNAKLTALINKERTILLSGDVTGKGTLYPNNNLELNATIVDNSHIHSTLNIANSSINSKPNSIVKTDTEGNIFSSGNNGENTGYKLQNGKDIGEMFYSKNKPITIYNQESNNDNSPIVVLKINNIDKSITLIHNRRNSDKNNINLIV